MLDKCYFDLGKSFSEWYKNGEVKFVYGTECKNCNEEIVRISKLIEYVKAEKNNLIKEHKY